MDDDGDHHSSDEGEEPDDAIFTLNGYPIPIHLHHSLGSGGRSAMGRKIKDAGGNPYATEYEARVIICRYNTPVFKQLEFLYDHDRYKWVEPPSWVDTCLMMNKYEHHPPGGVDNTQRRVNSRNPYSSDDDEHLVKFLAHRIPFKESGGRQGNGVYKDLCSAERASLYPWAERHTWQSWRDRYTKNQNVFDPRIAYAIKRDANPPKPGGKGQYRIPRRARRPQPLRYNMEEEEEEEYESEEGLEDEGQEEEVEVPEKPTNKRYRMESSSPRQQSDSPLQKRPRVQPAAPGPPNDASAGLGQDKRKGKGRRIPTEPEDNRLQGNIESDNARFSAMYDDNNEPGPYNEEPIVNGSSSSSIPSPSAVLRPAATAKSSEVTDGSRQAPRPMPPPEDSQITLAAPTQRAQDRGTPPPDTQATMVPPSPRFRPERPRRREASHEQAPPRIVARNTRSRRLPESEFVQLPLEPQKQNQKGQRGRPRKNPPQGHPSEPQSSSIGEREDEHASASVAVNASLREEVQVEEILQAPEVIPRQESQEKDQDDQGSSNEGHSSEDDEATRMLRNANQEMINQAAQSRPRPSRDVALAPNPQKSPYIDISRTAAVQAMRGGRKPAIFQPSSDALDGGTDVDATPKASQMMAKKTAKKTARNLPVVLDDLEPESPESEVRTETTDSSFPVESTIARDYKTAQSPFTPAQGTRAEERMRSERSKKGTRSTRVR